MQKEQNVIYQAEFEKENKEQQNAKMVAYGEKLGLINEKAETQNKTQGGETE